MLDAEQFQSLSFHALGWLFLDSAQEASIPCLHTEHGQGQRIAPQKMKRAEHGKSIASEQVGEV